MSEVDFTSLINITLHQAGLNPDLPVLTFVTVGANGEFIEEVRTYAGLLHNAQALARELVRLGLGVNEQFAIMMNNHPEFVEAMLAAGIIGATFIPVDPRTQGDKLAYMLDFTDCKGVISAGYCLDQIQQVRAHCPQLQWLLALDDVTPAQLQPGAGLPVHTCAAALATPGPALAVVAQDAAQPMFMMFTSGTTGNPKAVIYSHAKYMEQLAAMRRANQMRPDDKLYTGLSLTHINAQNTLRTSLGLGLPAVISRKFTKSRLWDICRHYRCTIFSLLGGMIPEIYAVPPRPDDADNPVRLITSSGMPASIWEDFCKRFGVALSEGYGSTEGGGLSNPPGVGPVGSIGKPGPDWEAAILDEAGQPCAPHVAGEICFRRRDGTPPVVSYYKNPQASGEKVRDGWLHMGDVGHMDENGWFFFHFRSGGGVRKNGDFVNTALVESMIAKSGLVADVFAYGVGTSANVAGEKALVVAVVPVDSASFSSASLLAFCRTRMEKNDIPDIVQVLAEIPKTVSEKPIEKRCIELLAAAGLVP